MILFNDEHPDIPKLPIVFTDDGISILINDGQIEKAFSSIVVQEDGFSNKICSIDLHLKKASLSMVTTDDGIWIIFNDSHPSNDLIPIDFNEFGRFIFVNLLHKLNSLVEIKKPLEIRISRISWLSFSAAKWIGENLLENYY